MMDPDCRERPEAALSDLKATLVGDDVFKSIIYVAHDFLLWRW